MSAPRRPGDRRAAARRTGTDGAVSGVDRAVTVTGEPGAGVGHASVAARGDRVARGHEADVVGLPVALGRGVGRGALLRLLGGGPRVLDGPEDGLRGGGAGERD